MSGRIGKVRMKESGFEFRVIPGVADPETDMGARLLGSARNIAEMSDLAGYMVIGVTEDGAYRCWFRWDDERSPIPRTLMPTYTAEIVRREMLTAPEAADVFDSKFEWVGS
jgi:hypothetical protein